ncbi:MAG: lamin tail domain-containing protein, partial [Acidobacteriota bacterium]
TGAIQIFDAELLPINRGDQVTFIGRLEQFGGATELNTAEDCSNLGAIVFGPSVLPEPLVLTVAQLGEAREGQLVRVNGVSVTEGSIPELDSGNLTISDDGGVSTVTLRIDGDTDLPGSNTPTRPFDLIGVVGQFDSFAPLTSGYQIIPRGKADFLTVEVNFPQVIISELLADPAAGAAGDANGDGSTDALEDDFVELVNTGSTPFDVSGFTLSDADQVRHVFAPGTVIPPREAAVVFGGGVPTGSFGNAAANGLVFTASTGSLALDDGGDTLRFADAVDATVQSVTFGAFGGNDQSLVRAPDFSNAPFILHTVADVDDASPFSPGLLINGQAFTVPPGAVLLTEVLYDASGADGGKEWFELYNATAQPVDLTNLCVGSGGGEYTRSLVNLDGAVIAPGATFVVGGPTSSGDNANPVFDLEFDFNPDFQNSGTTADGVALFNLRCFQV